MILQDNNDRLDTRNLKDWQQSDQEDRNNQHHKVLNKIYIKILYCIEITELKLSNISNLLKLQHSWNTAKVGIKHQSINQNWSFLLIGKQFSSYIWIINLYFNGKIIIIHKINMHDHFFTLDFLCDPQTLSGEIFP